MEGGQFRNLRVLLVEDESLVAMLIEDVLLDLNCAVTVRATTLADALDKAATADFDLAILDVNLNGSPAYPVAELLLSRGIPFLFSTGYGMAGIPEALRVVPILTKPFMEADVERALTTALASYGGSHQAAQRAASTKPDRDAE